MERRRNLAARAGRWSPRHPAKAIIGWLLFVLLAVFIGGAIGTKAIEEEDQQVGEARDADHLIADAFPENADETVLVQSDVPGATADTPASGPSSTTWSPSSNRPGKWWTSRALTSPGAKEQSRGMDDRR